MQADPQIPISVAFCNWLIRGIARLVPAAQRDDWEREWLAEIWHRWQFLYHAGAWGRPESLRLVRNCLGAFADASWHFVSHEKVQVRVRDWPRSPWACLGGLSALLLLLAALTSGYPATRQLLMSASRLGSQNLLFVWLHPAVGGGDRGLPADVVPAWATHSTSLESVAPFAIRHQRVVTARGAARNGLVVLTDPRLFQVLRARPALGSIPGIGQSARRRESEERGTIVLDHGTWTSMFHADAKAVGSEIEVGRNKYRVAAVLPRSFQFLTRQPAIYLIQQYAGDGDVMVLARARPGVTFDEIDRELTKIAENTCYYFFSSQLRLQSLDSATLTPLASFGVAVLMSALISLLVWRVRIRNVPIALRAANKKQMLRRAGFFLGKAALALALVFTAGLEWSRSESSVLFASRDPASGPFLVWLYVLGSMGVVFWSLADQRARCRVCLRLLCFPVRIGCPGCLLLDWSGTELLCTEGHGLLHVPHLAPSWDEESQRWISLDDSWSGLFAHTK